MVAVLLAAAVACGGDDAGDGGNAGTGGDALAERLVAVLESDGGGLDGDLDGAEVTCPRLDDPQPGDRATCLVEPRRGGEVEVDVEFDDDGSIAVVAMVPG